MSQRYFPISWDELHRDARALAWRLMEIGPFDRIVAIARGGLAPAAIIARELDIRLVDTICIVSYREIQGEKAEERGALDILKGVDGDGTGVLIIDDLVDSGETAKAVKAMLPKAHIAAVYAKPAGVPLADSYVTLVSQDTWIIFPWDEGETIVKAHAAGKRG